MPYNFPLFFFVPSLFIHILSYFLSARIHSVRFNLAPIYRTVLLHSLCLFRRTPHSSATCFHDIYHERAYFSIYIIDDGHEHAYDIQQSPGKKSATHSMKRGPYTRSSCFGYCVCVCFQVFLITIVSCQTVDYMRT